MTKKYFLLLLVVLLFTFGCSKKSSMAGGSANMAYYESQPQVAALAYDTSTVRWEGAGFNLEESAVEYKDMSNLYGRITAESPVSAEPLEMANLDDFERKLEKRANVRIRADKLEEADASVTALMEKHGAYASSTGIEETAHRYTIRVPSFEYDTFLAGTVSLGRLIYRNETTEDVTLRYYDLEGRLVTKRELLRTFQSYLGRARNIEEILSVEARLADLQNEIDWTGKELRNLANRVDYATIDLTILGPVASAQYGEPTLGEKIGGLFSGFSGFLSGVVVVLVGIVIYGIPIILLVAIFFWLFFGRVGLLKKLWQLIVSKRVP
jgi:hypothetical protein